MPTGLRILFIVAAVLMLLSFGAFCHLCWTWESPHPRFPRILPVPY